MARTSTAWSMTRWLFRWFAIVLVVTVASMFAHFLINGPDPEPKGGSVLYQLGGE